MIVELSEKGKVHDVQAKTYNQQAADFVFRANNSRAAPDEIDLHGLYYWSREIALILDMLRKRFKFLRLESTHVNNGTRIIFMCTPMTTRSELTCVELWVKGSTR